MFNLGFDSPVVALPASVALDFSGTKEGTGLRSGLLVREVKVSRVVTCTLSVLRSSTALPDFCNPDGILRWAVVPVEGCGEIGCCPSGRSDLLPPRLEPAPRGFPEASVALFRSDCCVVDRIFVEEDMTTSWRFHYSIPIPPLSYIRNVNIAGLIVTGYPFRVGSVDAFSRFPVKY